MPMVWNADADAKLFLGVLAQFKPIKSKLDYEALAAYMGSECTPCAIENRLVRLRRQVESVSFDASTTPKSTPSSTPRKRKTATPSKSPSKKDKGKGKAKVAEEEAATEVDEPPFKMEIEDGKDVKKIKAEQLEA